MDVTDYQSRLSRAKQDYNDRAKELKKNYDSELSNLQSTHELRQKKTQENLSKHKTDFEQKTQDLHDYTNKTIKDTVNNKATEYRERIAEQRDSYEKERTKLTNDYNQKLNDISSSYRKDKEFRDNEFTKVQNQTKERYVEAENRNSKEYNENINSLAKRGRDALESAKNDMDKEKLGIIRNNENKQNEIRREAQDTKNTIIAKNQKEMESLRENHRLGAEAMRDHHQSSIAGIVKQKQNDSEKLQGHFEELTKDIQDRNNKELQRQARYSEENRRKSESKFAEDFNSLKRKSDEIITGGTKIDQANYEKQRIVNSYENRLDHLRANTEDIRYKEQVEREKLIADHKEALQKNSEVHDEKRRTSEGNLRETYGNALAGAKFKNEQMQKQFKNELHHANMNTEDRALKERNHANTRIEEQRNRFNETMNVMSDKNRDTINSLQESYAKEKTALIEKARLDAYNERVDLKDSMHGQFQRKEESFETRLAHLQEENQRLIASYESKMSNLEKKYTKEINEMKEMDSQRRVEEQRNQKRVSEVKDKEARDQLLQVRQQYDKRIATLTNSHNAHLSKLTERYEDLISRERSDHAREMNRRMNEADENYRRLAHMSDMEKESLRNQYEGRLEKSRQAVADAKSVSSKRDTLA